MSSLNRVVDWIEGSRDDMTRFMLEMLKIKAVNPDGGGKGEFERAMFMKKQLEGIGLHVTRHDVPDNRIAEGVRVNLATVLEGEDRGRTLWLAAHLDTVPEGSRELWATDPYVPIIKDGKIFGRGAEDNGQAIASTLFAVKAMKTLGVEPKTNLGLLYVSDEESGSKYGVIPLLEKGIFKPTDMALVPDAGSPDGSEIEVAEKSILWLRITTRGRQVHGSTPEKGLNAHRIGMKFAIQLDDMLHSKYAGKEPMFDPPTSTFEPTKCEANVENVNTIPGLDVQYFDCRILPQYPLDEVMGQIESVRLRLEKETGAKIEVDPKQREQNTNPTPTESPIVQKLKNALKQLRGLDATPIGIGGGTVGAYFRRKGMHTAVWSTLDDLAHQPNEYCKIENMVNDAKVFAYVATT
ncbi:MAG TPA: M20 family metallo-hydrolase [Candidatus Dormibacteraeota bacterium]|nr:M20 family metallo-hydrolase [Candidatus Dormibacteraeota bacterium]